MKLEISSIIALAGILVAVEAAPQNSDKNTRDARISSTYYQELKTKFTREVFRRKNELSGKPREMANELADIELGVRLIYYGGKHENPRTGNPEGRIEVFQDGEWQKICVQQAMGHATKLMRNRVICRMKKYENPVVWGNHHFNDNAADSGVSKHVFWCDGNEATIFDCDKKEATCSGARSWEAAECYN